MYLILLAGSSRDDHTNQPKRQVMCYHRNKDDFLGFDFEQLFGCH